MDITNFTMPLPYFLGMVVGAPIFFYVIRAIIRSEKDNNKYRSQWEQTNWEFKLSSGHVVHFRKDGPHSSNIRLEEVYYGSSNDDFEDFTYWGKLIDESTPSNFDFEVWKLKPGSTEHACLDEGLKRDAARDRAVREIKSILSLKTKSRIENPKMDTPAYEDTKKPQPPVRTKFKNFEEYLNRYEGEKQCGHLK